MVIFASGETLLQEATVIRRERVYQVTKDEPIDMVIKNKTHVFYKFSDHSVPLSCLFLKRSVLLIFDGHDAVAEVDLPGDLFREVGTVALILGVEGGQ